MRCLTRCRRLLASANAAAQDHAQAVTARPPAVQPSRCADLDHLIGVE
jgi:hypothetical protein